MTREKGGDRKGRSGKEKNKTLYWATVELACAKGTDELVKGWTFSTVFSII